MLNFLYALTIGISAFLLFLVQPLISKILLPWFGGSASVWLTAMIFFQFLLLAGYAGSHWLAQNLKPVRLFSVYAVFMVFSLFFWPMEVRFFASDGSPWLRIFLLLLLSVGPFYFLLATTTPMVQFWIAANRGTTSQNPYILYAVSNVGSFAGLLSFPFFIEPHFSESSQRIGWSWGFMFYLCLLAACGIVYLRRSRPTAQLQNSFCSTVDRISGRPSVSERIRWLLLALLPVSALMAFTLHITESIINLPLLWVVPLCLYLLSFVICFLWPVINQPASIRTLLLLLAVLCFLITRQLDLYIPELIHLVISCLCLFAICLFFHGNLEHAKPPSEQLTSFYLYLSLGGCIGGILGGIAAPLVLRSNFDLNLILIIAIWVGVANLSQGQAPRIKAIASVMAVLMIVTAYLQDEFGWLSEVEYRARSFYGTYAITHLPEIEGQRMAARLLNMGNTTHGGAVILPDGRYLPMAYYYPETAAGIAMMKFSKAENIGVVGLGTGNQALYGRPGQQIDFFEIDPLVIKLATEHFDVLEQSKATIRLVEGDARLKLAEKPAEHYDLLFLDAFSSGSIPIHLLTLEAVQMYQEKLTPQGVMLFHISNRFADFVPVLLCNAQKLGMTIRQHKSEGNTYYHQFPSHCVALSSSKKAMQFLTAGNSGWSRPQGPVLCWTDSFSCLFHVVRFTGIRGL